MCRLCRCLQRSPKSGFRCTSETASCSSCFPANLQRSPKSGFRCTSASRRSSIAARARTCNDRPSQVSVAPLLRLISLTRIHRLQRSPKSGFRCTGICWRASAFGRAACNDRPSQVSVAPSLNGSVVLNILIALATIAQVRFPLHPNPTGATTARRRSCNDRPSQVSVAPPAFPGTFGGSDSCNDRPSQVSVAPLRG